MCLLLLAVATSVATVKFVNHDLIVMYDDPVQFKNEIQRHIPVGTPLVVADQIMRENGFEKGGFKPQKSGLHQSYFKQNGSPPFETKAEWDVALFVRNGQVVDYEVFWVPAS